MKVMNRREFVIAIIAARSAFGADPWTEGELIQPADLARRIEAGNTPSVICVAFPFLYRQRHIKGARFAGPGNKPEGISELERVVGSLPKDSEVVLYCGCCPMKVCPNIRPAYEALKRKDFKAVRVLNIPTNMHTDWTIKGYPSEPPATARLNLRMLTHDDAD